MTSPYMLLYTPMALGCNANTMQVRHDWFLQVVGVEDKAQAVVGKSRHLRAGLGLEAILPALIERVPPPRGDPGAPLRALLFDAFHDEYRGVVCLLEIIDGALARGDRVVAASTQETYEILEVRVVEASLAAPTWCTCSLSLGAALWSPACQEGPTLEATPMRDPEGGALVR